MEHRNFLNININNLLNNVDYLKSNYCYKYYILDVSNNAFNHGMYMINFLTDKIDYLYVNDYKDVSLIRKFNQNFPIILNGIKNIELVYDLVINNVTLIVKDLNILNSIKELNIKDKIDIILSVDVLGNIGFNSVNDIKIILDVIENNKNINLLGIKAKVKEKDYYELLKIINPLLKLDLKLFIFNDESDKKNIKLSNTLWLDKSIYGINKEKLSLLKKDERHLSQVLEVKSYIENTKKLNKGKKSYYVGVVPFGYLNGMFKKITKVYIKGKLYNVKEINDYYILIEIDQNIKINDMVEITSNNNPLEKYVDGNVLSYLNIINCNLPIVYNDYVLEKVFVY